jgi:hypothetical protein
MDERNFLGDSMVNQVLTLGEGDFKMITSPLEKKGGLDRIDQESNV